MECNIENIEPALLKVTEAAHFLAISERTVWSLIKEGRIPAVRFGRVVRVERDALDKFISEARR